MSPIAEAAKAIEARLHQVEATEEQTILILLLRTAHRVVPIRLQEAVSQVALILLQKVRQVVLIHLQEVVALAVVLSHLREAVVQAVLLLQVEVVEAAVVANEIRGK